ncbi:maleylpyruvate isomerase N-terminal domain-containing protein [Aestuariimicrobium soli]|uniref:maleylpyruvate isomerase N-terminal domain-containing protein n=1 Tax=Aestuariimicrobium soli TaxID=2035834 RepID=UPI003EBB17A2
MTALDTQLTTFDEAARMFADLADELTRADLVRPATDAWSVRDLLGHTLRAVLTVDDYLDLPGDQPDHLTPAGYYHQAIQTIDDASVATRGREAGEALGETPERVVREVVERVLGRLADLEDDPVIVTRGGAMHLSAYLPTRTLELVIHSLDLAAAVGRPLMVPADPMRQTLELVTEIVLLDGRGPELARALTGRGSLPTGFSVFAAR